MRLHCCVKAGADRGRRPCDVPANLLGHRPRGALNNGELLGNENGGVMSL